MAPLRDGLYFLLFHGALLSIAIYLSYFSDPGSSLFSWHPFLMTLSVTHLIKDLLNQSFLLTIHHIFYRCST